MFPAMDLPALLPLTAFSLLFVALLILRNAASRYFVIDAPVDSAPPLPQPSAGQNPQSFSQYYQSQSPSYSYPPTSAYRTSPTYFPPGTHPEIIWCFQAADRDGAVRLMRGAAGSALHRVPEVQPPHSSCFSLPARTILPELTNTDKVKKLWKTRSTIDISDWL